jgi:hypothetical protein
METIRQTAWKHPERVPGGIPAYSQPTHNSSRKMWGVVFLGAIALVLILAACYVYCHADAIDAGRLW